MRKPLLASALGALVLALSLPASAARTVSDTYSLGPVGDGFIFCGEEIGGFYNPGGACFALEAGETQVSLELQDSVSPLPVGAFVQFVNAAGDVLGTTPACGSLPTTIVPAGTRTVQVFMDGPAFAAADCQTATAVEGTITATFS